jgi:putative transposase
MLRISNTKNNPEKHHRWSIRLKDYDYSSAGAYFVTICIKERRCVLGRIQNSDVVLSPIGKIVHQCWNEIPDHFNAAKLDVFVIMPSHLHGVLVIIDEWCRGTACRAPTIEQFGQPVRQSLPTVVRSFKSAVTRQINIVRNTLGEPLWQRNYYEHIIRNEKELNQTREYILYNPLQWQFDRENPERIQSKVYDNQWSHCDEGIYGKKK